MSASRIELPEVLGQVMQADRHKLSNAWRKLQSSDNSGSQLLAQWQAKVEASVARREERLASRPELKYDSELPIAAHREEIIELLSSRQVLVVCGETGSGKSTQLPKICLEAGLGAAGLIGHTQPRRLAARAVASRLAEELNTQIGEKVGFKIRFTDTTKKNSLVKLMTDGILLAETQTDRFLDQYDALIIDEAHERSLNIDFLLGYLRKISGKRPDLKLIITSATIDPQRFAEHFKDDLGPAPIVEVSGRSYPVEVRYRPIDADDGPTGGEEVSLSAIASATSELSSEGPGDILVFLPTERDIRITAKHLRGHFQQLSQSVEILPLYARLSQADQNKIFAGHQGQRIVLATNVAESSLTVPGIHYVIDTGLARISRYAPRSKVQRLPIESVSQASANQRAGRCGRLAPGICIRLYSEDDYNTRSKFTTPEIRRSDLANVLLQSKCLKLGPLSEFPLLDPPSSESLRDADKTLTELGAVDQKGHLTRIGRQLGKLPCDPRVGRMLLESHERNCVHEVVIIAAALEAQDVRLRPAGQRDAADEAQLQFADPHSDYLSFLRLWDFYENLRAKLGRSRLERALGQKFLSYQRYREWADLVRQLKQILSDAGIKAGPRKIKLAKIDHEQLDPEPDRSNNQKRQRGKKKQTRPDGYATIHQSLLTGLLSGIAIRGDGHEYTAAAGLKVSLWPGSGLFRRSPRWIMSAEMVETTRRYARTLAEVDVEWIEKAGATLLKHSYYDPHWSKKSGAALVYKRSSLYGLPIVAGRRVQLAPMDPAAAQELLIEHGLVGGQWNCHEAFYKHNQELIADMHELAQRTRSREYILDRFHLANFYTARLPEQVYDLPSLKKWIAKHKGTPEERALWMQPEDLVQGETEHEHLEDSFPNVLDIGPTQLPLEYQFEPGSNEDGVIVTVPKAALKQLHPEQLAWLVPGLLEEKVLFLIRSLPKSLRTYFVPAPDVAKKLATELVSIGSNQPFTAALCEVMRSHSGEKISAGDFQLEKIPEYLKFMVRVVDDEGKLIDADRDIRRLQAEHAASSNTLEVATQEDACEWVNQRLDNDQFDELPQQITVRRGGLNVAAFPALTDETTHVEIRLANTLAEAERLSRFGFTRLFAIKHHRSLRSQVTNLPNWKHHRVQLSHLLASDQLQQQLADLIARIAFVENEPTIRDRATLDAKNARSAAQISIATQEIAAWFPKLANEVHQLRLTIEQAPSIWQEVTEQVGEQLAELTQSDFLRQTPWQWLQEYPRYLHAMRLRYEKLKNGGLPKDRSIREPIDSASHRYIDLQEQFGGQSSQVDEQLEALRWMIEEYRVSVFAQKLGTRITVSKKRIDAAISSISKGA